MPQLMTPEALQDFKQNYEAMSGLPIPDDFLQHGQVYACFSRGQMISGWVLSTRAPFRTLDVFSSQTNREQISGLLKDPLKYLEICCFWVDPAHRRKLYYNVLCWLKMSWSVHRQRHPFVLFGTNSIGLAKLYGHPKNSLLLSKDQVHGRQTFIFIARRKDLFWGVLEIIKAKILGRKISLPVPKNNLHLQLSYEIAR